MTEASSCGLLTSVLRLESARDTNAIQWIVDCIWVVRIGLLTEESRTNSGLLSVHAMELGGEGNWPSIIRNGRVEISG